MSSIALFPSKFSMNNSLVAKIAQNLDLSLYTDSDLLSETVDQFGGDVEKLQKVIYGKTSVFNQFTLEKEKTINMFKAVLSEKLVKGDKYLFYGFHSLLFSQSISEVLRVLVADSKENRIQHAIEQNITIDVARSKIKKHDVSAFEWTDFLFNKTAYDSSLYDLVLPVEGVSEANLISQIVKYYQNTSVLRTIDSQRCVRDVATENKIEKQLLADGHKVGIKVSHGEVVITVKESVFNFSKLAESLRKQTLKIDGVKSVQIEKTKTYKDSVYRQQKFELPSKVLFVDDEREFVQTVASRLNSRNVGTYGVYSGEEALTLIPKDKPDVMVLDLKMVGIQGTEVLRRTKEFAPEIEVIILTGHGSMQDQKECMKLGAFAYLNKPVDIEKLSETIQAANDKAHQRNSVLEQA